jgi:hypothetical protein
MHKNIGAAIIRQDEAKPAICVEELHPASWHAQFNPIVSARGSNRRPGLATTHRRTARYDRHDFYQKTDRLAAGSVPADAQGVKESPGGAGASGSL